VSLQEEKNGGQDFFALRLWDIAGNIATTNRIMEKWKSQLNSAGQKGPEK